MKPKKERAVTASTVIPESLYEEFKRELKDRGHTYSAWLANRMRWTLASRQFFYSEMEIESVRKEVEEIRNNFHSPEAIEMREKIEAAHPGGVKRKETAFRELKKRTSLVKDANKRRPAK